MDIQRLSMITKGGNTLSFFYNPENDLLTVDLVDKNGQGGNELVRILLLDEQLLGHVKAENNPMDKLETKAQALMLKPLKALYKDEMYTILQYKHWCDGMDFRDALEIERKPKAQMLNDLKTVWGCE